MSHYFPNTYENNVQFDENSTPQQIFIEHIYVLSFVLSPLFEASCRMPLFTKGRNPKCITIALLFPTPIVVFSFIISVSTRRVRRCTRENGVICICLNVHALWPQPSSALGTCVTIAFRIRLWCFWLFNN